MPLVVFARFHARQGNEEAVADLMRKQIVPVRAKPGCLAIESFQSTRDSRLFYFHSRWVDESAFDRHAVLPHTVRFLERIQPLIDHPLDVTRARPLE